MSTRTIIETDCDRCDTKNVEVKTIYAETGYDLCPAGGRSEPAGLVFDLCIHCLSNIVLRQLKDMKSFEEREAFVTTLNLKRRETY